MVLNLTEKGIHALVQRELQSWAKLPDDLDGLVFDRFREFERSIPRKEDGRLRVGDIEKDGEGAKGFNRYYRKNAEGTYYGYRCDTCVKRIAGKPTMTLLRTPADASEQESKGCQERIYLRFNCIRPECRTLMHLQFLGYM